ncbi:GDP-mannose transporter [Thraustotheca clavata]|uniref:GDP-mannose transporter n=1 Tax=Thraustotheca clavata TaxID=74557 RepID=A0A1W0A2B2_9STRA|nr:GDP-mannose transporter [Thraustotheca clavata]
MASKAAPTSNTMAIISCLVYSFMSNAMVLANRYIVGQKYYNFREKSFVILAQATIGVLILEIAKARGVIHYEKFSMETAKRWAPVTGFFVAMLYTGTLATAGLPIHIVTVFKNVTNLIIVFGEYRLFGEKVGPLVLGSLVVMLMGAVLTSYSDVGGKPTHSTLAGYFWMFMNCVSTAAYVLYMRYATTGSSLKLSKFGMAFYNNLVAIPLLFLPMAYTGDAITVWSNPLMINVPFLFLLFLSGVMGIGLNLASFWCVSVTSATTYATVGGLNKLPTTFIGVLLLHEELKPQTAIYVTFGMVGGMMYGYGKFKDAEAAKQAKAHAAQNVDQKV